MKLADLIRALSGIVCETVCQDDPEITTVTNNTAKVVPGALFCAIKGAKFDGHEYLTQAVDAGADHISCYALTAEEGSRLGWQLTEDDDRAVEFFHQTENVLGSYNIKRYEISNYAAPGAGCRHNTNVWRGGRLTAFGPAGAGFDGSCRYTNAAPLAKWLAGTPAENDPLPRQERLNEIFAVNLRTVAGWDESAWSIVDHADSWQERLAMAEKCAGFFPGCFNITPQRIALSTDGLLFWNDIAAAML